MADISIPGVSNKYRTNETVEGLMKVERIPLTREQATLESYQTQQAAWRDVNQKLSDLRSSAKTLYSFENPFNNKIASSTEENAITAEAGREASFNSFKVDVMNPAKADRFLSEETDKKATVPAGTYTYVVGEKTVRMNWKGGKLSDFVTSLNKRGGKNIKASLVNVSSDTQALLLESLQTGKDNRLVFKDDALQYAFDTGMLKESGPEIVTFATSTSEFKSVTDNEQLEQGVKEISLEDVKEEEGFITVPPRAGFEVAIPKSEDKDSNNTEVTFYLDIKEDDSNISDNKETVKENPANTEGNIKDIPSDNEAKAEKNPDEADEPATFTEPDIPPAGDITFKGVTIHNSLTNPALYKMENDEEIVAEAESEVTEQKPVVIEDDSVVFVKNADGSEIPLDLSKFPKNGQNGEREITISTKDYPDAVSLVIRNRNTGKTVTMTSPTAIDKSVELAYEPAHAIDRASDALFKYEGIMISRPTNDIDDVVPHITLHIADKTEKTATITVKPDTESAKDTLITFIGKYNQAIAEMNIVSQNKPELIAELEYLTADEKEAETKKLGIFQSDYALTSGKSALQQAVSGSYRYSDDAEITMLSQIGISTNASGSSGSYNASQMRGYLEVDEKKLDSSIENNLDSIKNLFGYDSDGDLIIDSGIGYLIDKQLGAWVQTGGLIASRTKTLESRIESSKKKISSLEAQLASKESELKQKYSQMEGTLNSLQSQSDSISNSFNRNNN
ncbi:MAG: flagellar filament capping protein FliD [Treponema sp.]|nr:flagellar filament capping protein FliD [Treponema sp.]